MLVGLTQLQVEYSFGTLQAHLQNKSVITKYDYCGYGDRVHRIPFRPQLYSALYWILPYRIVTRITST